MHNYLIKNTISFASAEKIFSFSILFGIFLLYYFLPTNNSDLDAYNYAASVKWGNELFFPHHLLYNWFQNIIYNHTLAKNTLDCLSIMKKVNASFAFLSLIIFYSLLRLTVDQKKTKHFLDISIVIMAASGYGFMRYATENEAYIIPVFFSLLSSYFFFLYLNSKKKIYLLLTGALCNLAFLFHQIHIFWYVGFIIAMVFFTKEYKRIVLLFAPSFISVAVYYLAMHQPHYQLYKAQNLLQFVLYDYYFGSADASIGINNFILGIISLIRSFIQVHGIIPILVMKQPAYFIVIIITFLFLILAFIVLLKKHAKKQNPKIFVKAHIFIFLFQFGFAVFSHGNAEFMVMLPFLILIIVNGFYEINWKFYAYFAVSIFCWNLGFGVWPKYYYNLHNQEMVMHHIQKNPKEIFILSEDVLVQHMFYYNTGIPWNMNIYKSPASMRQKGLPIKILTLKIDSLHKANVRVFTDCINEPKIMSRKEFLNENSNDSFFSQYSTKLIDSIVGISGTKYLYEVLKSEQLKNEQKTTEF